MSLLEKLQTDVKEAMKARQAERVSTLRMVISEIKKVALDRGADLDPSDELAIVRRAIKQRREAAEAFAKADRPERAQQELAELELLSAYLPAQVDDDELAAAIAALVAETGASSPADIGKVMGRLMKQFTGRLDGDRARRAVQSALLTG